MPGAVGDVAVAAGDMRTARTAYQAALDITTRLAAADPANAERQRDLSVSHNKLGDVAVVAGDLGAARAAYQASLDIVARLAAADPANSQWQRDLSISRERLSTVSAGEGTRTTDIDAPEHPKLDVYESFDTTEDQQFVTEQPAGDRLRLPNVTTSTNGERDTDLPSSE